MICLPTEITDAFKKALKDGTLDIEWLSDPNTTTEARRAKFGEVLGDGYSQYVNEMFEKKLLLKNQQAGMISWIKDVAGLRPESRNDLIARINKLERAFSPKEQETFLKEVADRVLKVGVSREEAQTIFDLSKKVEESGKVDTIKTTEDFLKQVESMDQSRLTDQEKAVVAEVRSRIEAEKAVEQEQLQAIRDEKEAVKAKAEEEKAKVREDRNKEIERIRDEKAKEREVLKQQKRVETERLRQEKEDAQIKAKEDRQTEKEAIRQLEEEDRLEREMQKKYDRQQEKILQDQMREEARIEKEMEAEEDRISKREQLEHDRIEREAGKKAESQYRKDLKDATGKALKKLSDTFKKISGRRPEGIKEYSQEMQNKLNELLRNREDIANGDDRMVYGRNKVELEDYVASLTQKGIVQAFKDAPVSTVIGTSKSLNGTLDDSAIFRPGIKVLSATWWKPLWYKNAWKTFVDIWKTYGGTDTMKEVRADVVSRENNLNGRYKKMDLAVQSREDAFPTAVPEFISEKAAHYIDEGVDWLADKIPGKAGKVVKGVGNVVSSIVGNTLKAADAAFTGFQYRNRADLADMYIDMAQKAGINVDDPVYLESLGKVVNSMTGRGSLGKLEAISGVVNNVLWSGRNLRGNIDTLTAHALDRNMDPWVRKQAAYNLVKFVGFVTAILAVAKAVDPDSVEFDPRSSLVGKIKFGDTTFDVTTGTASILTLASRILTWSNKSSTTGAVTSLSAPNAKNGEDLVYDFLRNKLSPAGTMAADFLRGKTFDGKPVTLGGELVNLVMPLPLKNISELKNNPDAANVIVGAIADGFGIATNTTTSTNDNAKIGKLLEANVELKQNGETTKSKEEIAQEVYNTETPSKTQINNVAKQIKFRSVFGYDDKYANKLNLASTDSERFQILQDAKNDMTDEEYKSFYKKARTDAVTSTGSSPILISDAFDKKYKEFEKSGDFEAGFDMSSDDYVKQRGTVQTIIDFGKAVGVDPQSAWDILTTSEKLGVVKGNLVEKQRFFGKDYQRQGGSEEYVKQQFAKMGISWKDRSKYNLEHIVPVKAGGGNSPENLVIIRRGLHNSYTKFDIAASKAVQSGRMDMKEIAELSKRLKVDKSIGVDAAIREANRAKKN